MVGRRFSAARRTTVEKLILSESLFGVAKGFSRSQVKLSSRQPVKVAETAWLLSFASFVYQSSGVKGLTLCDGFQLLSVVSDSIPTRVMQIRLFSNFEAQRVVLFRNFENKGVWQASEKQNFAKRVEKWSLYDPEWLEAEIKMFPIKDTSKSGTHVCTAQTGCKFYHHIIIDLVFSAYWAKKLYFFFSYFSKK